MYGYESYVDVTPEQILQKVTQQQIFEFVLKQPFNYSFRYLSPCREDKKADCRFEVREDGTILFVDFGERFLTGRTHRNCFRLAMDANRWTMLTSIKEICTHFKISTNRADYNPITPIEYDRTPQSTGTDITYVAKPFAKWDILHWSQFLIRQEHLKEDNVFNVARYTISSAAKGIKTFSPYKHCYAIDFVTKVKLYQPYQTDYKWITNCDENCIGNIDNLPPKGKHLIIQKSYKDHRVVRNTIPQSNVIYFQNEGCVPSLEILTNLTERFEEIIIFYDNDEDGILAAIKLTEIFNSIKPNCCRMVYLPKNTHKDPAQFIHKEGRLDLIEVFKQLSIWFT